MVFFIALYFHRINFLLENKFIELYLTNIFGLKFCSYFFVLSVLKFLFFHIPIKGEL
ncbi:hypothetical protein XCR1_180003 [Xenorhabdus cabanillasii JM26]|uniref:Uncharacterized protein n=1 Tax=Xenorhabdus cabanillasii JM26 TaxID=1427517 RepID=W1IZR5_9GAMM|nr:hypothetical protein XCR1_180003 [Xenorhabdus cabanillasii JM26]